LLYLNYIKCPTKPTKSLTNLIKNRSSLKLIVQEISSTKYKCTPRTLIIMYTKICRNLSMSLSFTLTINKKV